MRKEKDQDRVLWGLARRRQVLLPTWRGWTVIALVLVTGGIFLALTIQPFLAMNNPQSGGVLVIEGWAPDYALEAAAAEFKRVKAEKIFVTGGPIEQGAPLVEYRTLAERGAATLAKLGLESREVQAVPAPLVRQDRTYVAARALRQWWRDHGSAPARVTLITVGAHARRSRLMFEKAMDPGVTVGVLAVPNLDYDAQHWWRSSQGVRTVVSETIAYLYARMLFTKPKGT